MPSNPSLSREQRDHIRQQRMRVLDAHDEPGDEMGLPECLCVRCVEAREALSLLADLDQAEHREAQLREKAEAARRMLTLIEPVSRDEAHRIIVNAWSVLAVELDSVDVAVSPVPTAGEEQ